ncbi:MAG TPA: RNA methyltransferase [Pirellulales bacterium]|jgi:TrmH family RNA methyltransferase
MKLTSTANPRVKAAAKLRSSRERIAQRRFVINGAREIGRAVDAKIKIDEVFVCPELCTSDDSRRLLPRLQKLDAAQFEVTSSVYDVLAYGSRDDGVLAVAEIPQRALGDLRLRKQPLVAVLEGIEKPGNVGAVLRSADGAGVSAVIVADGGVDLYNPNAIRASLGTIFTMPIAAATSAETLAWLRAQKLQVFAARVDGSVNYTQCDLSGPCVIVLGNEATGLTDVWQGTDITAIALPMRGIADSLNISAAAAVLFYEALRQRSS